MSTAEGDERDEQLVWEHSATEVGPDLILFRARFDTMTHPSSAEPMERVVLESPDWANVVALTPENQLVAVRQFRFGSRRVTTEIPAGIVDPGEEPLAAARRELREECGYTSDNWSYLGYVEPNPAFLDNRCHHFLAEDAIQTHPQELDSGEAIEVVVFDESGWREAIRSGEMRHSLAISALSQVFDLRPS